MGGRGFVWIDGLVNFQQMIWLAGESQVTSAAVVRWTGGSEAVDPVGRVFAGVVLLSVEAVIPEAGGDPLKQRFIFKIKHKTKLVKTLEQ